METDAAALGVAPSWRKVGTATAADTVNVVVMMAHTPAQLRTLEATLMAVSDPKSPTYGEHLTQAAVTELMAPPAADVDAVVAWLQASGATRISIGVHRDAIEADFDAASAAAALRTSFATYHHVERPTLRLVRATKAYSVPARLAASIKLVANVISFPALAGPIRVAEEHAKSTAAAAAAWPSDCGISCAGKVTPEVLGEFVMYFFYIIYDSILLLM